MASSEKAAVGKATSSRKKEEEAPKKAESVSDVISVKNISTHSINTSQGTIKVGESGKATVGELRQLHKFLGRA